MNFSDGQISQALQPYGVNATPELSSKIRAYIELLLVWNKRISLTTVTNPEEILRFHFGESMFAASAVEIEHGRLADVGTGAGFPGLALKLARPALDVLLIESNSRKAVFLREVIRSIGLKGVEVARGRAEDLGAEISTFDFVTARAVGHFDKFLSWASGRLSSAGRAIIWIGEADVPDVENIPGWNWSAPVRIPASKSRCLLQGSKRT